MYSNGKRNINQLEWPYTLNANMADHMVGTRQALMFWFDNAFPEKSCFVVDLVPLFRPP